jgi:hypothetical protein
VTEQPAAKRSYPYMSPATWYSLRGKLVQSLPRAINADWLASVLDISEKGAANLLPQVRTLGLIGEGGAPSEIAVELRDDETYATACRQILDSIYPGELVDAYSDPETELARVATWFMRNARTGQRMAEFQARLYLTLLRADPNAEAAQVRRRTAKAASSTAGGTSRAAKKATPAVKKTAPPAQRRDTPPFERQVPTLHIDLQIHIAADASEDQIEAVFSSMAKHLYGK